MKHKPVFSSPLSGAVVEYKLSTKDFLVTGQSFDLFFDKEWDMFLTHPVPDNLDGYYQSEHYQPHQHAKRSLFNRLYGFIRSLNFRHKYRLIKTFHPNAQSILDFGSATGDFLVYMANNGFSVAGVEPNDQAREFANLVLPNTVKSSLTEITGQYDVISLWHVLEHVPKPMALLEHFKQHLSPNGIIMVAVPNFKSYDAQYYGPHWAAWDVPRHLWHFSPTAIKKLFKASGYLFLASKALFFDSFYVSLLSEQYKTGHKDYLQALYRGFISNKKARKSGQYSSLIHIFKR